MSNKPPRGRFWPHLAIAAAALWVTMPAAVGTAATQNGRIAFSTNTHGFNQIYTMNPDGSDQTRVAEHTGKSWEPDFSPDGLKLAFASQLGGGLDEIYTMNVDGSGLAQLTFNNMTDSGPAFSPDGSKIVFTCRVNDGGTNGQDICVVNSNGENLIQLTDNNVPDNYPSFSPGGQTIIYSCEQTVGDVDLCTINADRSGQGKIRDSATQDYGASYSPDGTRIVFYSDKASQEHNSNEIYLVNADGNGGLTQLTDNNSADTSPVFSPDGTTVAFDTNRNGNFDIYTVSTDGFYLNRLTSATAHEQDPAWAPASQDGATPVPSTPTTGGKLSIRLTYPKLKAGKTKRVRKRTFARYLKKGFGGVMENSSGTKALGASLVRVVTKKKRTKLCYRVDKPRARTSCLTTRGDGLKLKADTKNQVVQINYKPLARKVKGKVRNGKKAKRILRKMAKGRILRRGTYRLTFKAHVQTDPGNPSKTKAKAFRFLFKVR